jgi:hypothetical protein
MGLWPALSAKGGGVPCVHLAYLLCTQVRKDRKALLPLEWKVSTLSSGHRVGHSRAAGGPTRTDGGVPGSIHPPPAGGALQGRQDGRWRAACSAPRPRFRITQGHLRRFRITQGHPPAFSDRPINPGELKGAQASPAPPRTGRKANKKPRRSEWTDGAVGSPCRASGREGWTG